MNQFSVLLYFHSILVSWTLSIYFILNKKSRVKSGILLGVFFFLISIRYVKSLLYYYTRYDQQLLVLIGIVSVALAGPLLKTYVNRALSVSNPKVSVGTATGFIWTSSLVSIHYFYPFSPLSFLWSKLIILTNLLFITYIVKSVRIIWKEKSVISRKLWRWLIALQIIAAISATSNFLVISTIQVNIMALLYLLVVSFISIISIEGYQMALSVFGKKSESIQLEAFQNKINYLIKDATSIIYTPNLKIQHIADQLAISSSATSRLINQSYETNFQDFINSKRVEKARELLISKPDSKIESIAYEVGFSSPSAFYAAFRKSTPFSPSSYRKNHLLNQNQG